MAVLAVVLLLFLASLCFWDIPLPSSGANYLFCQVLDGELVIRLDSLTVGLPHGVCAGGLRIFETSTGVERKIAGIDRLEIDPLARAVRVTGARYPRLPDSYYAPGNRERNARVEMAFPNLGNFSLTLVEPDILAVTPARVTANVEIGSRCLTVRNIHLEWPDQDEHRVLDGFCTVDLDRQLIEGEVRGQARQPHIRPLLVALDIPASLPYFDGFTEVPGSVPSACGWRVNLMNNDFDLDLDLHPTLGRYNGVRMQRADGKIRLHVYTRGTSLNYRHVIGPIHGIGLKGQELDGTVKVSGTNGYNTVEVEASSALPLAELLRIGGFVDDYVGDEIFGDSKCSLEFRFPRAMTNNYEVLNGRGQVEVANGYLMRMKGFRGLLAAMPSIAPGISWLTDTTRASGSYVIENGVVKTDNFYLEGTLFSIKLEGQFDAVRNDLDFSVRVQFTRKDSVVGKILHPLTWPFSKLLLEFRLTGTPQDPTWTYHSVIHRLMEVAE